MVGDPETVLVDSTLLSVLHPRQISEGSGFSGAAWVRWGSFSVYGHGKITIRNVVADSCESALSLKVDRVLGGSFGADSSITGVTVMPGNQAQLRDDATTGAVGAWVIGQIGRASCRERV